MTMIVIPARSGMALVAATCVLASAGCGSSGTTSPTASGGRPRTSAQIEVNPPGDIPDNQAFAPYRGSGFVVSIPEGWARTGSGSAAMFADKYNSITIDVTDAASAPSVATARTDELPAIKAKSAGFAPGAISTVQRTSGPAVLITYQAFSPTNPVTGKVATEAVECYLFWRSGHQVAITLAAPKGSDNVDPWRTVTDSFRWSAP